MKLAVLDIAPTLAMYEQTNEAFARAYWHWFFLIQPAPLPERLIAGDPDAYFDHHLRSIGLGVAAGRYPDAILDAYRRQLSDPQIVEAICEDYRAGAAIDRQLDDADRAAGRRITCPVLCLWGRRGALEIFYGDVLGIWRPWATAISGRGLDASHFLAEDRPDEVAAELIAFLAPTRGG